MEFISTQGFKLFIRGGFLFLLTVGFFSPAFSYETISIVHGERIEGTVQWRDETVPERYLHKVHKNPDFCGRTFLDDALTVHPEHRGMENVVVFLENIQEGRDPGSRQMNIIKKCRFTPRMMGAVKGALIGFRHDDFITHNIHLFRLDNNATVFNIGLPIHRWQQVVTRENIKTGLFRMQCDIHAHMNGMIISLEHDYFDTTDREGHFELSDVPPGIYRLVALQSGYRIQNMHQKDEEGFRPIYEQPHRIVKEVHVKKGETTEVLFEFGLEN